MEIAASLSSECAGTPLLLVPVGAVEQHGPHLPLGTDTTVATVVAGRAGHPVTPPIAFGASGEHEGFAGTISIGTETLAAVLVETGRSACRWCARLLFVNGHGGNLPALVTATTLLRAEGRDAAWFSCGVAGGRCARRPARDVVDARARADDRARGPSPPPGTRHRSRS